MHNQSDLIIWPPISQLIYIIDPLNNINCPFPFNRKKPTFLQGKYDDHIIILIYEY